MAGRSSATREPAVEWSMTFLWRETVPKHAVGTDEKFVDAGMTSAESKVHEVTQPIACGPRTFELYQNIAGRVVGLK